MSRIELAQFPVALIETLYRENVSFRDRDHIHLTQCHMASEKFDAELSHNIQVSYLTLCKSP